MWTWWRLTAAAGLCGLLAACGGGGGGGGTDDGSTIPARAGQAEIGTTGGTVDAVLEGGTTLRIDIPADALKSAATLRIEPVPAQAGDLGGFRIKPANLALAKPVTLTLSWSPQQDPPADVALAVRRGNALLPISPVLRGQEMSFELGNLGALPPGLAEASGAAPSLRAQAQAAGRQRGAQADAEPSEETLSLVAMPEAERLDALRSAVDLARNGQGSSAFAMSVQSSFEAVLGSMDPASPILRGIALDWKAFVCAQRVSVDSALNTYEGSAGVVFEQRAGASLRWGLVARDMGAALGRLVPALAACADAPDDYRQPVLDKLPAFLERVEIAVFDVPFDQLIDDEMPPLINVETLLRNVDIDNRVLPTLQRLANRLRDMANTSCRTGAGQDDHAKLLARTTGDAGFLAIVESQYTPQDLRDDIQRCGMRFTALALDSDDRMVDNVHNLGATGREAEVRMIGAARLTLSGGGAATLRALQCPRDVSANNEQLVVEAGPAPGSMTELTRISSSNASTYLESSPELSFSRDALHELRDPVSNVTLLRVRRAGGLCSGAFAGLTEHAVLVQLRLVFSDDISGTWVGTISLTQSGSSATSENTPRVTDPDGRFSGPRVREQSSSYSLNATWQVEADVLVGHPVNFRIVSGSGRAQVSRLEVETFESTGTFLCEFFSQSQREQAIGALGDIPSPRSASLQIDPDGSLSLRLVSHVLVDARAESTYTTTARRCNGTEDITTVPQTYAVQIAIGTRFDIPSSDAHKAMDGMSTGTITRSAFPDSGCIDCTETLTWSLQRR